MDKKALYEKAEKAINQAFKVTKESVQVVSEKAGEAAKITKLLIERAGLEHQMTKQFAKLGHQVYERASRGGKSATLSDSEIKDVIEETKKLDLSLAQVEASIERERKQKKSQK